MNKQTTRNRQTTPEEMPLQELFQDVKKNIDSVMDWKEAQLFFRQNQVLCLEGKHVEALRQYQKNRFKLPDDIATILLEDIKQSAIEMITSILNVHITENNNKTKILHSIISQCEQELEILANYTTFFNFNAEDK